MPSDASAKVPSALLADAPPALDSRSGFIAALGWGVHSAIAQRARQIVAVSPQFADWPLDDDALLQALGGWLRLPQRRLTLLAADYARLPLRCPRFSRWRADHAHAVETWVAPAELAAALPTLLLGGDSIVQLFDDVHWRGRGNVDPRLARALREEIDVVLQRSERGWPLVTLGL